MEEQQLTFLSAAKGSSSYSPTTPQILLPPVSTLGPLECPLWEIRPRYWNNLNHAKLRHQRVPNFAQHYFFRSISKIHTPPQTQSSPLIYIQCRYSAQTSKWPFMACMQWVGAIKANWIEWEWVAISYHDPFTILSWLNLTLFCLAKIRNCAQKLNNFMSSKKQLKPGTLFF